MNQQTADRKPHAPFWPGPLLPCKAFLFALALLLLMLFPFASHALPPQQFVIKSPQTQIQHSKLYVTLALSVDNEDGLRDMLKDGAVLALGISIHMERLRWWGNEEVASREFVSTIMHDPLTRDFLLIMPGALGEKQYRDKNLTRLLHTTWQVLSLPVVSMEKLRQYEEDSEYIVILDFSLQHTEVPPWLEQSLIFWSSNVVPSQKLSLPFDMPAEK